MPGDDENIVKENPYREMSQFFKDFEEFIENLIKKYNLDSKYALYRRNNYENNEYNLNGSNSEIQSPNNYSLSKNSNFSEKSQIIDFETFKYLKNKILLYAVEYLLRKKVKL